MAQARVNSPVAGIGLIHRTTLKVVSCGSKFPLSNLSGLGNALHKAKVSQRDVKRLYAWLKTLKTL